MSFPGTIVWRDEERRLLRLRLLNRIQQGRPDASRGDNQQHNYQEATSDLYAKHLPLPSIARDIGAQLTAVTKRDSGWLSPR